MKNLLLKKFREIDFPTFFAEDQLDFFRYSNRCNSKRNTWIRTRVLQGKFKIRKIPWNWKKKTKKFVNLMNDEKCHKKPFFFREIVAWRMYIRIDFAINRGHFFPWNQAFNSFETVFLENFVNSSHEYCFTHFSVKPSVMSDFTENRLNSIFREIALTL